ncbi:hypothetical protein D7Z54_07430 [Salibacterium salarium]|uniref:Class II aldolase/adducin N-terminal domain-containing protein n=1 Tax=Salibacterium salarium TaxID=284579 RepID=A0A428N6A1_9BACI|nr:class II aldolase/adducin family protein [Salibacterium salarium]RSL33941.1 hypothetical protein D7Z54_07430 [Salibacterium salarium]
MLYQKERNQLADVVKKMFDRYETNTAGGNVSVRMNEEHIIMTPTLMSQEHHCNLSPYQILVVDMDENIIEGDGRITREINMHMACYKQNEEIGCVLHGHALHSLVFATMGMDMPNLIEATQKLGKIKCLDYAPATSPELADKVKNHLESNDSQTVTNAILLNKHGVVITDKNLTKAYDIMGRLEYNAYIAEKVLLFDQLGISPIDKKEHQFNLEE